MKGKRISHARLRELLIYDADAGVFSWRVDAGWWAKQGEIVGTQVGDGYLKVVLDGWSYQLHRLAWFYMTGEWPRGQVDHRNGVRADNKFSNLRDVSVTVNQQNRRGARAGSTTGLIGVSPNGPSGYVARIQANGRRVCLGTFATPHEAHAAYLDAKRAMHEGNTL